MVVTYRQTLNDRQEVCTRDTCMGSTGLLSRPTRFDYAASHFVYIFGDFFSKDDVFLFFSPTFCRFRQSTNSRCQSKQVPPVVIFKSTLIFLENNLSSLFYFSFWSHTHYYYFVRRIFKRTNVCVLGMAPGQRPKRAYIFSGNVRDKSKSC